MTRRGNLDAPGPSQHAPDAADWWAAKHLAGGLSTAEERVFRRWLEEPAHAEAYARSQGVLAQAAEVAADPVVVRLRAEALRAGPERRAPRRFAAGLAASILLAGAGGLVLLEHPAPRGAPSVQAPSALTKRYAAAVGERRALRLDDGSTVALNTGTVLEVAFSPQRRSVRLLRGEAHFQVAKSREWPFVVTAGDRTITAVGTAFDVRLDGDRVRVVLEEGRVKVEPLRREGLARLMPRLAEESLAPGQQLVTEPEGQAVRVASADLQAAGAWRQGQVIFRDDSLSAAVAELNRYSARKIVVDDARVAALKVSGVFRTDRPENFVAAVETLFPVAAKTDDKGVTVLSWRGD